MVSHLKLLNLSHTCKDLSSKYGDLYRSKAWNPRRLEGPVQPPTACLRVHTTSVGLREAVLWGQEWGPGVQRQEADSLVNMYPWDCKNFV